MRIVSLNGWGGRMAEALLPYIASVAPDVLCLQEVVHSPEADRDWLDYRDDGIVLPQRANFFRDVCAVLPGHFATFCPAARGLLWDGDRAVPSFWGLATFVAADLPVTAQVQGFVHREYSPEGYGAHPRSRSGHGVRVFDHARGGAVSITQMHGLRDLSGKGDTPERRLQAGRLAALSRQVSEEGDLRVVCGDFNVEPGSETLRLLEHEGLTELVARGGHAGTRSSLYRKPGRFADYMLVNRPEAVTAFEVVRSPEVSDHCPLVLDI